MHWLDLNRSETRRVLNVQGALEDRSGLEKLRSALSSEPAPPAPPGRFRDQLDSKSARSADPLADRVRALTRATVPSASVTELPLVESDGLVADRRIDPGLFVQDVVPVIAALERRGEASPVTESPFGLHVFVLLEKLPRHLASDAERDAMCPP
jgi:hypothetical protein